MTNSTLQPPTRRFSLLAPVPEIHLISGQEVWQEQGKVAFGSQEFEVFRKLDQERQDRPVKVLIYASNPTNPTFIPQVTWQALYVGHVDSRRGRHPQGMKYRPASTENDPLNAAVFWEIIDMKPLEIPLKISNFKALGKKEPYQSRFFPEKPVMIEYF